MSVEDKKIGRLLERELHRNQSLDLDNITILVARGVGYLGGVLRPAAGLYYVNIKDEVRVLTENARKIPGLKDLVIDARLEEAPIH